MRWLRLGAATVVALATLSACGSDSGSAPRACESRTVAENFPACSEARTRSQCLAACGQWGEFGINARSVCYCDTPDGGEPCGHESECAGSCTAPPDGFDCSHVQAGQCADYSPIGGCLCFFIFDGVQLLCLE